MVGRNRNTKLLPVTVGNVCDRFRLTGPKLGIIAWTRSSSYLVIERLFLTASGQDQRECGWVSTWVFKVTINVEGLHQYIDQFEQKNRQKFTTYPKIVAIPSRIHVNTAVHLCSNITYLSPWANNRNQSSRTPVGHDTVTYCQSIPGHHRQCHIAEIDV